MKNKPEISAESVSRVVIYNPETGIFTRKIRTSNRTKVGAILGTPNDQGYLLVSVENYLYRAHRLAWLLMTGKWPSGDIDHKNGNRADNRFCNLREATRSQNMANMKTKKNVSGIKGVVWNKFYEKWQSQIGKDGKCIFLGLYHEKAEAAEARRLGAIKYHGEFTRT